LDNSVEEGIHSLHPEFQASQWDPGQVTPQIADFANRHDLADERASQCDFQCVKESERGIHHPEASVFVKPLEREIGATARGSMIVIVCHNFYPPQNVTACMQNDGRRVAVMSLRFNEKGRFVTDALASPDNMMHRNALADVEWNYTSSVRTAEECEVEAKATYVASFD